MKKDSEMCQKYRECGYPENIIQQELRKIYQQEEQGTSHRNRQCYHLPFIMQYPSYSEDIF